MNIKNLTDYEVLNEFIITMIEAKKAMGQDCTVDEALEILKKLLKDLNAK